MTALYEVAAEYRAAAEALAESDLDPQTIADTLEGLAGDIEAKAIAVASVIRNIEAERDAIKGAIADMAARAKAADARAGSLRDYLRSNMEACDIKRVSCPLFAIAIKANPARVVIDCADNLPPWLMTQPEPPAPQPDKNAIRDALKLGQVSGAHLESTTRLEIK